MAYGTLFDDDHEPVSLHPDYLKARAERLARDKVKGARAPLFGNNKPRVRLVWSNPGVPRKYRLIPDDVA